MRAWKEILLLLLPTLLFLAVFTVGFAMMVTISVHPYVPPPVFMAPTVTIANYASILFSGFTLFTIGNTLLVSLESTLVTMLFAYPLAQLLVRPSRRMVRKLLSGIVILLLFVNSAVRTASWMTILGSSGLLNNLMIQLHIIQHPVSYLFTNLAVVLGIVSFNVPFAVLMLASSLRYVGVEIEDAAKTLGADELQTFRFVTLPLSELPVIATANLMFVISLTAFVSPAVLGGGVVPFITVNIYNTATQVLNLPLSSAYSVFFTLLVLLIIYVFGKTTARVIPKGVRGL